MNAPAGSAAFQYHPYDVTLRSATAHPNPFLVDLRAHLSAPDGRTTTVRGCYDGDGTWLLRLCPDIPGAWSYVTESPDPALDGQAGTLQCRPNPNPSVHGALGLDPAHPCHFLYQDGTRPFVLGYEANWLWVLASLPDGAARLDAFCARIAGYGYNHVFVNAYAHDTTWAPGHSHAEDYGPPPRYAWAGTNEAPDHRHPNVAYWRAFDVMMRALFAHGLTAHLYLKVYNKGVTWPERRSVADDLYFGYVVARYGGFSNVVWDFAKESYNEPDKAYLENRLSLIKASDGYRRLVTAHDDWAFHFDPLTGGATDFVCDQKHDNFAARVLELHRHRRCPVINAEFAYECGPGGVADLSYHPRVRHTPEEHVLRSWEVVFGGGYPGYYYLYTAWDVLRPEDLPPGYALHRRLVDFMTESEWWRMTPHPAQVERSSARCLRLPEGECLIFNAGHKARFDEATRAMIVRPFPGPIVCDWLQPLSGERARTEISPPLRFALAPPFDGPYAVRLRPAG